MIPATYEREREREEGKNGTAPLRAAPVREKRTRKEIRDNA